MPMRIVYKTGHGVSRVGHSTNQRLFTFQQHSSYHQIVKNLPDKEGKEEPGNRNNTCLHFLSISHPPTRSNIVYNNKPPRKAPDTQDTGQKGVTKKKKDRALCVVARDGCSWRLPPSQDADRRTDGIITPFLIVHLNQALPPTAAIRTDYFFSFLPLSRKKFLMQFVTIHQKQHQPTQLLIFVRRERQRASPRAAEIVQMAEFIRHTGHSD